MGGIKSLFPFFETLYFKKRQKLTILWRNIAKIGTSGASQASKASSWFFSWFTWGTELLVLAFLMKILPVFGGFRDKPIKNNQKNKITDVLGKRKNYDSNLNALYIRCLKIFGHFNFNLPRSINRCPKPIETPKTTQKPDWVCSYFAQNEYILVRLGWSGRTGRKSMAMHKITKHSIKFLSRLGCAY